MSRLSRLPAGARAQAPPVAADAEAAALDIAGLYRSHERQVLRWAARLGGPGIDAEDIAQEVFLIAKRRLNSTFDGGAKVSTWLFRTTEKVVQSARKKQRLRRWISLSGLERPGMSGPRPMPGEALSQQQEIAHVYTVLDRLPERERRVLILFEIEELPTHDIAVLIGARVGTVRVWLFRARARFMQEHQRLTEPSASTNGVAR